MAGAARAIALTGADQVVMAGGALYKGFTVRETVGAVAVVRVWDNATEASGTVLEEIALAANESARECYTDGIWASAGIFVDVVSGTVAGSIRIG
jgi:hypothetical protein